jgi:type II secretory pathway pseudopilin PulG
MYGLKPVALYQSGFGEGIQKLRAPRRAKASEEGYILLAVLVMVVFVLIALSVAAPKVAADIQRDREVELVHRGQQYTRAIKLYYKKFGAYPPSLDALEKSNNIRFLRKRYKDPMTGKDDWHLIHFGENKTPSYGFFGQAIGGAGGSTVAGVGPQGATGSGGLFSNGGSSGSIFSSDSGTQNGTLSGSQFGSQSGTQSGTDPNSGTTGTSTDPNASGSGSSGTNAGGGAFGGGFGTSNNASPLTIGGLGVIGVESTSPKLGILVWKKKTHYNEWEFWYDPNAEKQMVSSNLGTVGQPMSGSSGSSSSGFGSQNGSGFGSQGSTNQNNFNGTTGTTPTQPQ